jgi:sensor histidine kinase YesM
MGGGMPIGGFVASKEHMSLLTHDPMLGHLTTFGGHPVNCAAALANLDVLIEDEPEEASKILRKLITYLRAATPNVKKTLVTVKEEVKLVNSFLGIQQSRFENRMSYKVELEKICENIEIPSFTILTLAENAVKHAIEPSVDGGDIQLSIKRVAERLLIVMTNTSLEFEDRKVASSSGVGLQNIKERLVSLYGDKAELILQHRVDGKTQATISIPFK